MEQWKDIPGYEGYYQISNMGRVKSLTRVVVNKKGYRKIIHEKILAVCKNGDNYSMVCLSINQKRFNARIHRIVAELFIPNPDNLPQVNHKFGDKDDNRAESLEWCTASYNIQHAFDTGLKVSPKAGLGKFNELHHNSERVEQYTLDDTLVKVWPSMAEAERHGFQHSKISSCCNGKRNKHKGYKWRYAA